MSGTKVLKGREKQAIFRVGKFVIHQVPLNIAVSEMRVVTSGPNKGIEAVCKNTSSFHASYENALVELLNRCIKDNMTQGTVDMLKGLIDSIEEAKQDIIKALHDL